MVIGAVLIQILREVENGGHFMEPILGLSHQITGFAFVDDIDLVTTHTHNPNVIEWESLGEMQDCINR